jgi:mRNA interferase MazF
VRRGEVWWAQGDTEFPVVLLSGAESPELRAVQIVAPATEAQKRGFVVLSAAEAAAAADAGPGVGIEVFLGAAEGLDRAGVVRVALPHPDRIFCTWQLTVARDALIERAGTLSGAKLAELQIAVRLAGIE